MKHALRSTAIPVVAVVLLAASVPAGADDCLKWENQLLVSEVYPNSGPMTFGQEKWYNRFHLGDTAQEACDRLLVYRKPYTGYKGKVKAVGTGRGQASCYYQKTNPDNTLGAFTEDWTTVSRSIIPKQPCCNLTPDGPYKDVPSNVFGPGSTGNDFTSTEKDAIRIWNYISNESTSRSDIGPNGPGQPWPANVQNDYFDALTFDPQTFLRIDDGFVLLGYPTIVNSAMQVDHIIPRVDVSGCECGPNSQANALLISAQLNRQMSNNCDHPTRQAILEKWSFGPN